MTWKRLGNRLVLVAMCTIFALFGVAAIVWAIGDAGHEPLARQVLDVACIALGFVWIGWCGAALVSLWPTVDE